MRTKQNFTQDQLVMIRRIDDKNNEYRAKVVGLSAETAEVDFYIVELIDSIPNCKWTHVQMIESCLDPI